MVNERLNAHETMNGRSPFQVGDWLIEPDAGRVSRNGRSVKLEPKAMDLLVYFAQRPGQVLAREDLEQAIWDGTVVGYDALTSAVIKLRKALDDHSRNPQIIETVAKRGYRLIAEVTPVSTQPGSRVTDLPRLQAWLAPRRVGTYLAIFATVIGMLITAHHVSVDSTNTAPGPGIGELGNRLSLVVLPFTNSSSNKRQEYFSDGIADDLISDLSQYSGLYVIARRTAYAYKQRQADIQTIARELGVSYVLDGDVRREGNMVRLNVQLIDAKTGLNIWAQRFDRETKDIFRLQDEVRKKIMDSLSVTLTKEERNRTQRRYTDNFAAYDLFLQGQAKLATRASAADSKQAQELMERAIKLDPDFARAHAALALILADAYTFNWTGEPEKTRQEALRIGRHAIELDPQLPQAHWILGYVYLFLYEEYDKAIEMGKLATKLAPYDSDGLTLLAVTYLYGDDPANAALIVQDLMRRNTEYSSLVPSILGLANILMGKYPEALDAYDKSIEINPSRVGPNVYKLLILHRMGKTDDAAFQLAELYSFHPDFDLRVWAARQPFKDKSVTKTIIHDLLAAGVREK